MAQEFEFSQVHTANKRGFLSMLVIMLGFSFFSASMWAGGSLGVALTSPMFLGAVLIGNLILGCYTGLLAYIASKTGLSTHLLAHYSFGTKGSKFASGLLSVTQVGWFGVGVAMFALPVQRLFPDIPLWIWIGAAGILMTSTAGFGIRALALFSLVAVPVLTLLGLFSVRKAFCDFCGDEAWWHLVPTELTSCAPAVVLCIASFFCCYLDRAIANFISDYTHPKSSRD